MRYYCDYCDKSLAKLTEKGRVQHNHGDDHRAAFERWYLKKLATGEIPVTPEIAHLVPVAIRMTGARPPGPPLGPPLPGMGPPPMGPPGMMPPGMPPHGMPPHGMPPHGMGMPPRPMGMGPPGMPFPPPPHHMFPPHHHGFPPMGHPGSMPPPRPAAPAGPGAQ